MKLIVNADDFGMSRTVNQAVADAYNNGVLTSTSVMPNMPAFEDAMRKLKLIPNIGLGVHLNLTDYKSKLRTKEKNSKLYDKDGFFNNNFIKIFTKSNDEDFMFEVEHEFRAQIEAVLKYHSIDHINSHKNIHSIPKIFNLVCKLAKEYEIPTVRVHREMLYLSEKLKDKTQWKNWFNKNIYLNFLVLKMVNYVSEINFETLEKYGLHTSNYSLGMGYSGLLDTDTIIQGIEPFINSEVLLELICHVDTDEKNISKLIELKALCSSELKQYLVPVKMMSFKDFNKELVIL